MSDSFTAALAEGAAKREQQRTSSMIAELDQMAQADASPAPATPYSAPAVSPSAPPAGASKAPQAPGFMGETKRALVGGVRDAAQNALNLIDDAATWLDNNLLDLRIGSPSFGTIGGAAGTATGEHKPGGFVNLPEVEKSQAAAGQVARSVTQFAVPFMGSLKALKAAGALQGGTVGAALARGTAAGAATDFAAFDPHEKRLANLLVDAGESIPVLKNPITEYLAASPADSNAEGRLKNTLEGLGIGMAAEAVFRGAKAAKGYFAARGGNPAETINAAAQAAKEEAQVAAQAVASQEKPRFFDRLLGAPKQAKQEAASVPREVAGVEPLPSGAKAMPVIDEAQVSKLAEAAQSGDFAMLADAAKSADFNFSHLDTAEDVKQAMDAFSAVFEKGHHEAAGGVQSLAHIGELAREVGATTETLRTLYEGTDNLAARVLAHRSFLVGSAEKVSQLAKMVTGQAPRPADLDPAALMLAMRKQVALHATIQAQVKGIQSEVARTLSAFRIDARAADLARIERDSLIDAMGGLDANMRFAQQLSEITNPAALNAVIRKSWGARTADALFEAWVNGLLSGPATHAVNAVGNGLVAIGSLAERGTASLIGRVLRNPQAVEMGEAKALAWGMAEGLIDALRITRNGLSVAKEAAIKAATGDVSGAGAVLKAKEADFGTAYRAFAADAPILDSAAHATRPLDMQTAAISADRFGLDPRGLLGNAADGLGALIRTPGRLLTTSDELFKAINYRGELRAQAYRTARGEGLEGEELFKRIAGLLEDPSPELSAHALKVARENTFTASLGEGGQAIQKAVQAIPGPRYLMPFIRTPANIMKYVGTRTPGLNLLADSVRTELAAGGARRDIMLAKTATGAALYAAGAYLASQGIIVGGGDMNQTAEKMGGELPYSIHIDGTYYAFNRLDPVGMFLGLSADMADIAGHLDDTELEGLAAASVLSLSRNLVSKSYLSGLVNLINAIDEGRRGNTTALRNYVSNMAGTFVPLSSLTQAVRKETDPVAREVFSVMDAIKNRIPGFSKELPPMVNLFGEDVLHKGGLGPDIASPIRTSDAATDPASTEIARLNLDLRLPPKSLHGGGSGNPGVDLEPWQYHRLLKLAGNEAKINGKGFKEALTELVQSDRYKALPEDPSNVAYVDAKEKTIRLLHEAYKKQAAGQLLQEDESLRTKWAQNKQNAANALAGKPVLPF